MGWIGVTMTRPPDAAFCAAIRQLDESNDWKMRAIAGRTVRQFVEELPPRCGELDALNQHGLSAAHGAKETQAWLFGFRWTEGCEVPPLIDLRDEKRCRLCFHYYRGCGRCEETKP